MKPDADIETLLIHGASAPDKTSGAQAPAIAQSAAYAYATAEELEMVFAGRQPGYVYSRIANPTVSGFERRITALEDGLGAVACSSGMAAISATVLGLAGTGDEVVSGGDIFSGTYSLFQQTLTRYGITTRFVPGTDAGAYRDAINDRTKLIFLETIGNPGLDVADIAKIAGIAREKGVVLVVDNTVTTPLLLRPKTLGADIVLHSTSKFINGHGRAIGGVVVDCGTFDWSNPRYAHLKAWYGRAREMAFLACLRHRTCRDLGCCLAPFNAFLMSIGIESLGVRMERHCANAQRVASFLASHPGVRSVRYPGLKDHPDHAVARRQFSGRYGALLTLRLDSKAHCFQFINGLKRVRNVANLGECASLAIHPLSTFCRELDAEGCRAAGVTDDLVRLSIGIEPGNDILSDLDESLRRL